MSEDERRNSYRGTLLRSFRYAFAGLWTLIRTQRNARIHFALTGLVVLLGLVSGLSRAEWMALVLTIALVLAAEAFNTAIESLVDLVSPAPHPLARQSKDIGAGAVLLTVIAAVVVGALIFLPRLLRLLGW